MNYKRSSQRAATCHPPPACRSCIAGHVSPFVASLAPDTLIAGASRSAA